MSEAWGVEATMIASRRRPIRYDVLVLLVQNPLAAPGSSEPGHRMVSGFFSSSFMSETSHYKTPRDLQNASSLFLALVTIIALYLSGKILLLFVFPLAWSSAFAILLSPYAARLRARIPHDGVVASTLTLCLAVGIIAPSAWAAQTLLDAAITGVSTLLPMSAPHFESRFPKASELLEKIESVTGLSASLERFIQTLGQQTRALIASSVWGAVSVLLTLFTFFYMIRDGRRLLNRFEDFIPLSQSECSLLFGRISDTIHATLFGSVVVSALQGFLGGILIWWLNLPGAPLWGLIMGLLALVPYLGAFVVWVPLAVLLAMQDHWHDAMVTTVWGLIVIGLSDNLLYPILVGKRLRYHSLLVFFFLVGGVWCFGGAGIILGPIVLATLDTAIDIWRGTSAKSESARLCHADSAGH